MILERGDMWSIAGVTDWFLITTNPIVNRQGLAVMGRGMAKQAADRFPTLRKDFADRLAKREYKESPVFTIGKYEDGGAPFTSPLRIGCFMVKHHWRDKANLKLISGSTEQLAALIDYVGVGRVDLNFPGIGNGGLAREAVLPIIERLPDNVHVWEYVQHRGNW